MGSICILCVLIAIYSCKCCRKIELIPSELEESDETNSLSQQGIETVEIGIEPINDSK